VTAPQVEQSSTRGQASPREGSIQQEPRPEPPSPENPAPAAQTPSATEDQLISPSAAESPANLDTEDLTRVKLKGVEDDRRVVPSEWGEWLRVFGLLKQTSLSALEAARPQPVSFLQMFDQPEVYRGRLIRTQGYIRRAHRVHPPRNSFGIDYYHQLWLQVDDHPSDPVAVWCLEVPAGFPLGMAIEERAEIVGYFFKITTYLAGDGKIRRAPLLLAREIRWQPRPRVAAKASWEHLPYVVLSALGLSAVLVAWVYFRTRPKRSADLSLPRRMFA
jgi:hypothetical protein